MTRFTLTVTLAAAACAGPVPHQPVAAPKPAPVDLDAPGLIRHEAVLSARWSVPRSGLIDLTDPKAAHLEDGEVPIALPVHVLVHPERGTWVIDTGVPEGELPVRGPMAWFADGIETVEPLGHIVARQDAPLAGVLLTHNHLDHVLGLPDVPADVPVHVGLGDHHATGTNRAFMFPTFKRNMEGHTLRTFDFEGPNVLDLEGIPAIDVFGDGQLYALDAHGHTPGSTAYLARTPDGPVLFTGDCSHTRWGWDHGVTPGTYTEDHEENAESLEALRALAARHPGMRVEVGHELRE